MESDAVSVDLAMLVLFLSYEARDIISLKMKFLNKSSCWCFYKGENDGWIEKTGKKN